MENTENVRPGEGGRLTRRRMLSLSTMAVGLTAIAVGLTAAGVEGWATRASATGSSGAPTTRATAPPPVGVLGADVDQNLDIVNFAELPAVKATWLRGFYPMQDADQGNVASQPAMQKLTAAIDQHYGTVLNLKFNYNQGLPAPGSSAMNTALRRLDNVLAVVMGKVDIVVVGNEPFFECGGNTATLNDFYEALALHTIDYRQQHPGSSKTQIYMGALTDLENPPQAWIPQINRWLDFVRNTTAIAGTDIHPHVASVSDGQKYLDYIVPRLRPDQKFLATEFSLVKLYQQHLTDPVPTGIADRYGIPRGTLVWQVVRDSIQNPVPQGEWNDLLLSSPWFADTRQFMSDMVGAFRNTGRLAVAAYPLAQGTPMVTNFGPNKTPWVFTSMFCPHTTQQTGNGLPGQNVTWTNQFRSLQSM
jgi:hypothetical protein